MSPIIWIIACLLRQLRIVTWEKVRPIAQNARLIDCSLWRGSWWEVILKLSWGLPNTLIGYLLAHSYNLLGLSKNVSVGPAVVVLAGCTRDGAFSIGGYIFGPDGFRATPEDHLYVHEYGHYLQGLTWGVFFVPCIAIPSLLSAARLCTCGVLHEYRWFEINANRLSWRQHRLDACVLLSEETSKLDERSYTCPNYDSPYPNPRGENLNKYSYFPMRHYQLCLWDVVLPLLTLGVLMMLSLAG